MGVEGIIVDTDVLIALVKKNLLDSFLWKFDGHITVITLYEYVRGRGYFGKLLEEEKNWLEKMFTILPLSNDSLLKASEIWITLRRKGELVSDRDILNASIAISSGLPFCTGNTRHYKKMIEFGLDLVPWKDIERMM